MLYPEPNQLGQPIDFNVTVYTAINLEETKNFWFGGVGPKSKLIYVNDQIKTVWTTSLTQDTTQLHKSILTGMSLNLLMASLKELRADPF